MTGFARLEHVRVYIDDLLIISKDPFDGHCNIPELVLEWFLDVGLELNATKSALNNACKGMMVGPAVLVLCVDGHFNKLELVLEWFLDVGLELNATKSALNNACKGTMERPAMLVLCDQHR